MSDAIPTPSAEQEQRARWDLMLLDIELRTEQVRQLKRFEPWRLAAALTTAAAVTGGAVAGGILWAVHTFA